MEAEKIKAWGHSLRLRTIPLSISGSIVAGGLACSMDVWRTDVFLLMLLTSSLLQILSNMANDYGDFTKGTDNEDRIGPARALQRGQIKPREFLLGTLAVCVMTMLAGFILVLVSFGVEAIYTVLLFLALGASCIWAAVRYTVGKRAYGYRGMGDVFVFVFFGLVPVVGGLFLYTHSVDMLSMLPAAGVGLMSSGVLNLNNMRDVENDRVMGKRTIASRMSFVGGKVYHTVLLFAAAVCFVAYQVITGYTGLWYVILVIPVFNAWTVWGVKERAGYDKYLKVLSLSTFVLSIIFSIALNINL
jgi:1,4-dihydroxy-2-naphthoate octaprenyltransferase